ncbi:MAG: hypothetical protein KJ889_06950 [Gammaproteobacteria bacterium]|nr:hypothetical protein [Gammaproteobacteria bacterium]MBU4500540.1 hypothetical protein [Gammaproteobacteria bacterium]
MPSSDSGPKPSRFTSTVSELGVATPIIRTVCQILFEGLPAQVVDALLNRHIRAEF